MKISHKFSAFLVLAVFAAVLSGSAADTASAHKLTTAKGKLVNHGHYGQGGPYGYPMSDEWYEKQVGFKASDRIYNATGAWNAHGRTFDNRQSWVFEPDKFKKDDPPVPAVGNIGDTILFFKNGTINHSVSIVGPWQGLNTKVMSKYGTQGQYKHELINPVKFYGYNWAIVNFKLTPTYVGFKNNGKQRQLVAGEISKILEQSAEKPWHKTVLESEKVFNEEHPKLIAKFANMTEENTRLYANAKTDDEKIAILTKDFLDDRHYVILSAYDRPEFGEDFLKAIESGKLFVEMVKRKPEFKQKITTALKNITDERKNRAAEMVLKQL
ncbi:hypothetical protein HZC21_04460 [Candidatus Peregrinibacteria bacterium]|nr:hypothetical protein [Candidatus Peregrinibacteria bacterium]